MSFHFRASLPFAYPEDSTKVPGRAEVDVIIFLTVFNWKRVRIVGKAMSHAASKWYVVNNRSSILTDGWVFLVRSRLNSWVNLTFINLKSSVWQFPIVVSGKTHISQASPDVLGKLPAHLLVPIHRKKNRIKVWSPNWWLISWLLKYQREKPSMSRIAVFSSQYLWSGGSRYFVKLLTI